MSDAGTEDLRPLAQQLEADPSEENLGLLGEALEDLSRRASAHMDALRFDTALSLQRPIVGCLRPLAGRSLVPAEWLLGCTGDLVDLLRGGGRWDAAEAAWRRTLKVLDTLGKPGLLAHAWTRLGYLQQERFSPEAATTLDRARRLHESAPSPWSEWAWFHFSRAYARLAAGDPHGSFHDVAHASEFLEESQDWLRLGLNLVRAEAHLELGTTGEAGLPIARSLNTIAALRAEEARVRSETKSREGPEATPGEGEDSEFRLDGLEAEVRLMQARVEWARGDVKEAEGAAARALEVLARHGERGVHYGELEAVRARMILARVAEERGLPGAAESWLRGAEQACRALIERGRFGHGVLAEVLSEAAFLKETSKVLERLREARELTLEPFPRPLELLKLTRKQLVSRPECEETRLSLEALSELLHSLSERAEFVPSEHLRQRWESLQQELDSGRHLERLDPALRERIVGVSLPR